MSSGSLNLNRDNLITGINVIDGVLYWTDDRNEPRKIDIETYKGADHSSGTTVIYNRDFQKRDITVIKPHPTTLLSAVGRAIEGSVDLPFRDTFPRFSYRWRYSNFQYSPLAPFTAEVFSILGSEIDEVNSYLEGVNSQMINHATSITISSIPIGGDEVEAIDIVYTESISSTVYVVRTIEITAANRLAGNVPSFDLSARNFGSVLPPDQLLRPFDNVPRLAKAQETTANRLIYANYLQNYIQPSNFAALVEVQSVAIDTATNASGIAGKTIKGDRTYEVGVVFKDSLGREGGLVNIGSTTVPFYNDTFRNLTVQITETAAPSWADTYKYYVKDVSGPHYNLATTDSYNDTNNDPTPLDGTASTDLGSTYIWLAFQSRDRNKILGGDRTDESGNIIVEPSATVLIPKRHTTDQIMFGDDAGDDGTNEGAIFEGKSLHPVLEVQNEAPEIVLAQIVDEADPFTEDTPNQDTINLRSEKTDGKFFVKIKRATDAGSGGGNFLASGRSDLVFGSGTDTLISQTFRVTNTFSGGYDEREEINDIEVSYIPFGGRNIEVVRVGVADHIDVNTHGVAPILVSGTNATIVAISDSSSALEITATGVLEQIWFETVPLEGTTSGLDLFWETSDSYRVATDFGMVNNLTWSNAIGFRDIIGTDTGIFIEENSIESGFNTVSNTLGVKVNTPQPNYTEERRSTGLIFSGLFNDRTGINRLNQFIQADGITKELEPNYGSIQKLHTRDTNLIVFCEDKVFRIQADKDALFNADGSTNVASSNSVLGQTIPYIGEYGISNNPESFAFYGHNIFFSDARRGVVIQLTPSNGQLFEISSRGLNDFFRDRLGSSTKIIGSYDDYDNSYDITIYGNSQDTVTFNLDNGKWVSRRSYISEGGLSNQNVYYTFKEGRIWAHNSSAVLRNNFYGNQFNSTVQFIFNDSPSNVKEFLTLGYEGAGGWLVDELTTDLETTGAFPFTTKENKFYSSIATTEAVYEIIGTTTTIPEANRLPSDIVDGEYVLRQTVSTRIKSGSKGVYMIVSLRNSDTVGNSELFAVNSNYFISS